MQQQIDIFRKRWWWRRRRQWWIAPSCWHTKTDGPLGTGAIHKEKKSDKIFFSSCIVYPWLATRAFFLPKLLVIYAFPSEWYISPNISTQLTYGNQNSLLSRGESLNFFIRNSSLFKQQVLTIFLFDSPFLSQFVRGIMTSFFVSFEAEGKLGWFLMSSVFIVHPLRPQW